jgi:hypothetical protein
MTQINSRIYTVTVIDANTISLNGVDGAAFPARTSGGTVLTGKFYALKPSANIETLTPGNTLATDYWGANGVAANYDEVQISLRTDYPNNGLVQRFGNAGNAVFAWATAADRAQAMLGMPASGGVSSSGTGLFGNDYFYQYIRNELCVRSRGYWTDGGNAGVRLRYLNSARADASAIVGFAASRYQ